MDSRAFLRIMSCTVEAGPPRQAHVASRTSTDSNANQSDICDQTMNITHNRDNLSDIQVTPSYVNASIALQGIKKVRKISCKQTTQETNPYFSF